MQVHFGFQCPLDNLPGELLDKPALAHDFVLGQPSPWKSI
jgi:hypothetical protein